MSINFHTESSTLEHVIKRLQSTLDSIELMLRTEFFERWELDEDATRATSPYQAEYQCPVFRRKP